MMRMILIAGLAAAGLGLAGTSGAQPSGNCAVIDDLATDHVTPGPVEPLTLGQSGIRRWGWRRW